MGESVIPSRRGFIAGVLGLFAAPAIVSASSLMPVHLVDLETAWRGNQILTLEMITREAIRLFMNTNAFLQNIDSQYNEDFCADGAKIGTTLRIRYPLDYTIQSGIVPAPQSVMPSDVEMATIGAAAVLATNPPLSRRNLFGLSRC